jgi:DNA-binding response OmpR family regulator
VAAARILVADDNPDNRDILRARLEASGYTILIAHDGTEALAIARSERPDLILLDVMMPGLDGVEVCRRLKSDASLPFVPIVMVTARTASQDIVAALDAGADEYLAKPVDHAALVARVRSMLRIRALHEEVRQQASQLHARALELTELNRTLEQRVQDQLGELERVGRLRRFFSPQLAEAIVAGGADDPMRSHRSEVTVVFLDLRGFTAFAERSEPEEVMRVLREYHAQMGRLIVAHEGTLERFTGDGMMVFFNDPVVVADHAQRALRMAVAMRAQVAAMSSAWRRQGIHLGLGIGIAQGFATIGAIGFEGRLDYGAVGTVTNLAARLCAEARDGQILTNRKTLSRFEALVEAEPIGELSLKGFSQPVAAFNVVSIAGAEPPARVKDLSAEGWDGVSKLLDEALDLAPAARAAWLERQGAAGPRQAELLRKLLDANASGEASDPLAALLPAQMVTPSRRSAGGLAAGARVGPYRLLRELGAGGMADVWLAERTDGAFAREVALKLPRTSLLRPDLATRFERECDILARLEHPHIARLHDAGVSPEGLSYLAMEFVDGQPIDRYCEQWRLDVAARLELFAQALAAVQYAHAQLVIHRDLKPSNILVAADGRVRLLDFGIAKLLFAHDGVAFETELTREVGRRMTPDYASPEQIRGEPLGVASDVYSLGVVLYELLTGQRPYRLKLASAAQLEDAIVSMEPSPPSSVVCAAAERGGDPGVQRASRELTPDLDAIALTALAKTPARRYPSAAAFAADIERHLQGRPRVAAAAAWPDPPHG